MYRLFAFGFSTTGLLKQIGVFDGIISFRSFMYYTVQSNLLAVMLFAFLAVRTGKSLREGLRGSVGWHSRLGMVCTVDLLMTLIVFWVLLVPEVSAAYLWTFDNIAVHTVTPLLCLFDYILFSEQRQLKYRDVYYVCIFPVCYVVFSFIAGLTGYVYYFSSTFSDPHSGAIEVAPVRVPYFFLDFDRLGFMAAVYIAAILVFILLLSHTVYFIDRRDRTADK